MDGLNEKKWFVYIGDHHEGPFSLFEIQPKVKEGRVTTASYVWADGMADWKMVTEVPEFETLFKAPASIEFNVPEPQQPPQPLTPPQPEAFPMLVEEASTGKIEAPKQEISKPETKIELERKLDIQQFAAADAIKAKDEARRKKTPIGRAIKYLVLLSLLVGGVYGYRQGYYQLDPVLKSPVIEASVRTVSELTEPYLLLLADKVPALGKWISPIRALDDVTSEDYEELKAAARGKADGGEPRIALALSRTDPTAPFFYISSNLPDGVLFDLYIEGISETLLNSISFSTKASAVLTKKLGKSGTIRLSDGKPIPRGEYTIYAMESDQQKPEVSAIFGALPSSVAKVPGSAPKGKKLVISKTYFLGGAKDANYSSRLKDFHDKLRTKAAAELVEIKQFAWTLESQFNNSVSKFTQARRGTKGQSTPAQKRAWGDFHRKWSELNAQLSQTFQKWTPTVLESEYFYGALYRLTQQAGQAVERAHSFHDTYFNSKVELKAFDIQLGEATSFAQGAIQELKAKIEQTEKIPPSPSGMPRREGL